MAQIDGTKHAPKGLNKINANPEDIEALSIPKAGLDKEKSVAEIIEDSLKVETGKRQTTSMLAPDGIKVLQELPNFPSHLRLQVTDSQGRISSIPVFNYRSDSAMPTNRSLDALLIGKPCQQSDGSFVTIVEGKFSKNHFYKVLEVKHSSEGKLQAVSVFRNGKQTTLRGEELFRNFPEEDAATMAQRIHKRYMLPSLMPIKLKGSVQ